MLNKKVNRNYFCRGLCTSLATTGMPAAFFPLCDIYRAMLMLECNNKTKKTPDVHTLLYVQPVRHAQLSEIVT